MHVHLGSNAAVTILLGVILLVASFPNELASRFKDSAPALPGGLLPRAPVALAAPPGYKPPIPKKPDGPINKLNPGGPSFKGNPVYKKPVSYSTYTETGERLQKQFNDRPATAPDISHDFVTKIKNYDQRSWAPKAVAPNIVGDDLASLTGSFQNAIGKPQTWRRYAVNTGGKDVLDVYHSPQQKSIVVKELFVKRYTIPEDQRVPFSELIFQSWSREAGDDATKLKFVTIADIDPPEFLNVIRDARKLKDSQKAEAGGVISFDSNSIIQADKDAFASLAGMDNTRNVFYMLSDHKLTFRGRGVTKIHTSGEGSIGGSAYHVTFELAD